MNVRRGLVLIAAATLAIALLMTLAAFLDDRGPWSPPSGRDEFRECVSDALRVRSNTETEDSASLYPPTDPVVDEVYNCLAR